MRIKWACPKCEAGANEHGEGGGEKCLEQRRNNEICQGFLCECDDDGEDEEHGLTHAKACPDANCYHCGWGGTFPQMPKKAAPWEKKALAAGWIPPGGLRKFEE